MENEDLYKILGAEKNASQEELKKLYRKLSMQYHPDRQAGKSDSEKKDAEEKFKKINSAYSILGDPEKRRNYDQFGTTDQMNGGFGAGGIDPMEFFRKMHSRFGNFDDFDFGFHNNQANSHYNPNAPQDGDDIEMSMEITFIESMYGGVREFDIDIDDPCEHCHGTGSEKGKLDECPHCHGSGMFIKKNGFMILQTTCPHCQGTGRFITEPCTVCHGLKTVKNSHHIMFNIPKGIIPGKRIRIKGGGCNGLNNGNKGDLYIRPIIKEHELFKRVNDELTLATTKYVSVITATFGGDVDVQTPWGIASLKIPNHTENNKVFRIPGYGVRVGDTKGDLYVRVVIEPFTKLNSKQKKLLKDLEETLTDDNLSNSSKINEISKKYEEQTKDLRK